MPSILPNFEYDIFISYRHNDNRSGWVTDFVNALQEELASTIKEPLSIYFDKNPHDGLLETHSVDKSLEGKLKCLIFIPIISQTYCHTKSFAWQHEFCAFNRIAQGEGGEEFPLRGSGGLGRDIKVLNGNVASRILPIKIHDLDLEDKTLLEKELGGALRAIEFIFKSPGVNRPLTVTDNPDKNQNKTFYKDQVNKVANAVKEIITSLKNPIAQPSRTITHEQSTRKFSHNKKPILIGFALLLIAIASYFIVQQLPKSIGTTEQPTLDKSIAVLSFVNMSNDPEQEYFSDGMTDEILNRLFKIGDLKVVSRTSSMKFKGAKLTVREIANQLGVTNILEGSVQKAGNRIKITVQLIDAVTDTQLWSETYEREFNDVFAIQSEIAHGVAQGLSAKLNALTKRKLNEIPTQSIEAYNLYLKGNFEIQKVTPESLESGLEMMRRAIQLDPDFALPYLGIAFYYGAATDFYLAPNVAMPQLKAAALTAMRKDSTLADAHAWFGFYNFWYSWDWVESEKQFVKAIQLEPNKSLSHWVYSWQFSSRGDFEKSIQESARTVELEPMDALIASHHALMYYYAREYDKAIKELDKVRAFETNQPFEHFIRGQCYSKNGKPEEAIVEQKLAHELFSSPWSHARLAYAYAIAGDAQRALSILESLKEESVIRYVASDVVASVYVALGDYDSAFEYLEKGINERAAWMVWIQVDPIWDPIRKDHRFISILEKMNLNE